MLKGLDVSHWEQSVNWQNAKADGFAYMMTKASQGDTGVDNWLGKHVPAAHAAGLVTAAYHMFDPADDGAVQAQHFLATIKGLPLTMRPIIDWELVSGVSAATQIANVKKWLDLVEAACGKPPVIYCGPSFFQDTIGNPPIFGRYPLWIAEYRAQPTWIPSAWKTWTFWQNAIAREPGVVPGSVDTDFFNGDATAFQAFLT